MYRPWNLYREDGEPHAETKIAIELLETFWEKLRHPGACYLYIHAVEAWQPKRAEACADVLPGTVPGVAHMQHMPISYLRTNRPLRRCCPQKPEGLPSSTGFKA